MVEPTPTSDGRKKQKLGAFNTITEALDYAADGSAGANFYSVRGELAEALPYRLLRDQAKALARRLLSGGLHVGDRVSLIAETEADFLRGFFACAYAGLVPVPMPLPVAFGGRAGYLQHIRGMIEASGARAVFTPASLLGMIEEATQGLDLKFCGGISLLNDIPDAEIELPSIKSDDLAYLQFSSGSTRFPLGVAVTHQAALANARGVARDGLQVCDGDRCMSWLPFYHDMGLVGFMLSPLASQLSIDYLATRDFARRPLMWLQLISRNKATISYSPSFGFELCARRGATASLEGISLESWRVAGIGGDMIRPQVLRSFDQIFASCGFNSNAFVASYGMAEATLAISFAPLDGGLKTDCVDLKALENDAVAIPVAPNVNGATRTREFSLCGHVLPEHAIEIRRDDNKLCDEREIGRVFVRGPSLMKAYFGKPEETEQVLSESGWLDTGDLGYLIDGSLVVVGRAKDLILVNGRNVWPQDLEWAVEHGVDGLRSGDVAAISVDDGMSEHVVVLLQCRPSDPKAREEICRAAGDVVRTTAGIECAVVPVPAGSLPMTSSGKLSRTRARGLYLSGVFAQKTEEIAAQA